MIHTSWDIWNTRCHVRWSPGNPRDQSAIQELDRIIELEYQKGIDEDFPYRSYYLFENYDFNDVITMPIFAKKAWLQAVEAARIFNKYTTMDDGTKITSIYEPERKLLRQWMETGRY